MRTAYQHFSKIEFCSKEDIHGLILAFLSFYEILTKDRLKVMKFKTQSFDIYNTASLVRIHHIALLANKHDNQYGALKFLIKAIEMTLLVLPPTKFEEISDVLYIYELFIKIFRSNNT